MKNSDALYRFAKAETERLIIRRISKSDVDDMYEYSHMDEVTKYLLWRPHPDSRYTAAYINSVQRYYKNGTYFDYAVILKSESKMIGTCGFAHVHEEHDSAEVGYVINPAYHNKGYATEALMAMLRIGFCNIGFNRIEARYMIGNDASRRVMDKCGLAYEGAHAQLMLVKGSYADIGVCAMLARDFYRKYGGRPLDIQLTRPSLF